MARPRFIPCLLLQEKGLVKTWKFRDPVYVGDPINAVKIFNDKEVDELVLLDISAGRRGAGPDFPLLEKIAREAFMPMAYGGGLSRLEDVRRVLGLGFEKVVLNAAALSDPSFVSRAAQVCGRQSVVVGVDVKKTLLGRRRVYRHAERGTTGDDPVAYARAAEAAGAGEIFLTSVDRDGTRLGYDLDLVRDVSSAVSVPVIACGGARDAADMARVIREGGASAAAAGSLFVFHGSRRAVLISYPSRDEIRRVLS
jgi:cyclase